MADPHGFSFLVVGGEVRILHHGAKATILRGSSAADFLAAIDGSADPQLLMARATGNYRRGNERTARSHPRNQSRGR